MTIPPTILPLVKDAFQDLDLIFEETTPVYQEVGISTIHVLHNEQYVCSFNKLPDEGHRFDYRLKGKHLQHYFNDRKL